MYLTDEEYRILELLVKGFSYSKISEMTGLKLCTNDPRVDSLYQKYGVYDRMELIEKADLSKIEVVDIKDIPYFEYDHNQLIKKIPVSKKDVQELMRLLEDVEDDEECFNLVHSPNTMNETLYLEAKNGKKYVYERLG